jgi:hypoxanthine phosphoribosyltransferase
MNAAMSAIEAHRILDNADLLFTAEQVTAALRRVASELNITYSGRYPLVLSVMGGAVVFTGQILPLLAFPLEFDIIQVSRYGAHTSGQALQWRVEPRAKIEGRDVLVLDDILDEGVTLAAIRDLVLSRHPASCRFAVFADKEIGRPKPIHADFTGLTLPDRFVFGFGMDVKEAWRNLPAIYAVKD